MSHKSVYLWTSGYKTGLLHDTPSKWLDRHRMIRGRSGRGVGVWRIKYCFWYYPKSWISFWFVVLGTILSLSLYQTQKFILLCVCWHLGVAPIQGGTVHSLRSLPFFFCGASLWVGRHDRGCGDANRAPHYNLCPAHPSRWTMQAQVCYLTFWSLFGEVNQSDRYQLCSPRQ